MEQEKSHSVVSETPKRVLARTLAEDVAKAGRRARYRTFTQDVDPSGDRD
jgi:hypothetical protein